MVKSENEKILVEINKKLDRQDEILNLILQYIRKDSKKINSSDEKIKQISEQIVNRDNLLISITKEVALLRNDLNNKIK